LDAATNANTKVTPALSSAVTNVRLVIPWVKLHLG